MKITNKGDVLYKGLFMKTKVYAIRDSKAETFGQNLMLFRNNGEAIRSVEQAMEAEGVLKKYPEDFALFCLGEYNQEKGELDIYQQKQHITDLIELTKK